MNVVEAVDRWIDQHEDELSDDDYDAALDIVDALAESDFAEVDADVIDDDDIDAMVALLEDGDADFGDELLRSAIYGDPVELQHEAPDAGDPEAADLAELEADAPDSDGPDSDAQIPGGDRESAGPHVVPVTPIGLRPVSPIEFREGDELGPSFLSPSPRRRGSRSKRVALSALMAGAFVAFGIGTVNLIDSLDEPAQLVATAPETDADEDVAVNEPEAEAAPQPAPNDPAAVEQAPGSRVGIRLVTGDVLVATWERGTEPPTFATVYDAANDDLVPAVHFAWLDDSIAVADADGNVHTIDLTDSNPKPQLVYRAGGGLGKVVQIGAFDGRIAVRTELGDVLVFSADEPADPDQVTFVWSPDEDDDGDDEADPGSDDEADEENEEGVAEVRGKAVDLASRDQALAFTLDNGDAKLVMADALDVVEELWSATDQPPAYIVRADGDSFLIGVGDGAVARFDLSRTEAPRTTAVWDPFTVDPVGSIDFGGAGTLAAIVLGDGSIVLADETATGEKIWDANETELRTVAVSASESEIFLLLEAGSVVHLPLNQEFVFESIWDVTDETLSPANQIELEPSRG